MSTRLPLFAAGLVMLSGVAVAQTERMHDAHVHGRSQIDLVYESGALALELLAPGIDIVGFEHTPTIEPESTAIAAANASLAAAASWLAFEPAGICTVTETNAHEHGYTASDEHDHEDGHEHASAEPAHDAATGDHDDGHDHDAGHAHAEFHASIKATCTEMPAALQIRLHERFPGLDVLRIDMITDAGQNRIELTRGQTRVSLSN